MNSVQVICQPVVLFCADLESELKLAGGRKIRKSLKSEVVMATSFTI